MSELKNTRSTFLLFHHLPRSSLNIWGPDPYACCPVKATHRHKQLLSRLWSSQVTWSNTPWLNASFSKNSSPFTPSLELLASIADVAEWQQTYWKCGRNNKSIFTRLELKKIEDFTFVQETLKMYQYFNGFVVVINFSQRVFTIMVIFAL